MMDRSDFDKFGGSLFDLLKALAEPNDRYEDEGYELEFLKGKANYPKGMIVVEDAYGSGAHVPYAFVLTAMVHMQVALEHWNADEDFQIEDVIRGGQTVQFAEGASVTSQMSHFKDGTGQFSFFVVDDGEATPLVTIYAHEYAEFISEVLAVKALEEQWKREGLEEAKAEGEELKPGSEMTYDELVDQYRANLLSEIEKSRSLKSMMSIVKQITDANAEAEFEEDGDLPFSSRQQPGHLIGPSNIGELLAELL